MIRSKTSRVAIAACLLSLLLAVGSITADAATTIAPVDGRVLGDGDRTLVWLTDPMHLHVLDVPSGARYDADIGGACTAPTTPSLSDVGGGEVLLNCATVVSPPAGERRRPVPVLFSLATRTLHAPAGFDALSHAFSGPGEWVRVESVGAHGLRYSGYALHNENLAGLLDWRTGAGVSGIPTQIWDVDSPTLLTTVCPSVQVPTSWEGRLHLIYAAPYAVSGGIRRSLTFQRCDRPGRVVLRRADGRVVPIVQLSGGFASWWTRRASDGTASTFAYLPSCDLRLAFTALGVAHLAGTMALLRDVGGTPVLGLAAIGDVCERARQRSGARVASAGGVVRAQASSLYDARIDADERVMGSSRRIRSVRDSEHVTLTFGAQPVSVVWRIGDDRARRASRSGTAWALRTPVVRRARTLTVVTRYADGGEAHFALRLRPLR
jgi:hypothetical protein